MGTMWREAEEAGELCEMTQVDSCGKGQRRAGWTEGLTVQAALRNFQANVESLSQSPLRSHSLQGRNLLLHSCHRKHGPSVKRRGPEPGREGHRQLMATRGQNHLLD